MKRFFSLFLSFVLLFAVCACSREKNLTELEEIQQQLAEMEAYACTGNAHPAKRKTAKKSMRQSNTTNPQGNTAWS